MATGSVTLFTQDGEHLAESTLHRAAKPTMIAWHPTRKLLATGWASGEVIMWNEETHVAYECKRMHDNITCLTWSFDGSRLFSADDVSDKRFTCVRVCVCVCGVYVRYVCVGCMFLPSKAN